MASHDKLFGTDGIRGTANTHPMTAEIALKLGMAAGQYFNRASTLGEAHRHRAVIAKDTRLSGYMIEPAITSGLIASGMDVVLVGPLPTPAVAMLVRSMRADLGVMISASHNPYADNGIKLFGPDGFKLSDEAEAEIERSIAGKTPQALARPDRLGRARRLEGARGRYIEFAKSTFPKQLKLDGLTIVVDCANGAAYQVGPLILSELGARVIPLHVEPNGFNINDRCGSTHPQSMCEAVRAHGADAGIALDGDADRLIICDETGTILDGDQLMAMIAEYWNDKGWLKGGVAATQMSNMGLERLFKSKGIGFTRTKVGDRYVVEAMRERGWNVGGEQSGHMILSDYATTGDGLVAALQVLALLREDGRPLSQCGHRFDPLPQLLKNVRYTGNSPLNHPRVQDAIDRATQSLGESGRVFVRASGTEPLIRVMLEGEDRQEIERLADSICAAMHEAAA